MTYLKMLSLSAVAAVALMAFAGTASASTFTSPPGTNYTGTITGEEAEPLSLHPGSGASFLTIKCNQSHVRGKVEQHGAGVTAKGPIELLTFAECGNDVVTVLKLGSIEGHPLAEGNGTITSTGAEVRVHTSEGPICTLKTNATDIGTLTGGKEPKFDINSSSIPTSGFLCPSTSIWTGGYKLLTPSDLTVD